jgi:hypothetical protein
MLEDFVHTFEKSAIAVGAFVSLWGMTVFWVCFKHTVEDFRKGCVNLSSECTKEATWFLCCIFGLIFCTARANTLKWIDLGGSASGILFIVGITLYCSIIATCVWMGLHKYRHFYEIKLWRIIAAVVTAIVGFGAVGLVRLLGVE